MYFGWTLPSWPRRWQVQGVLCHHAGSFCFYCCDSPVQSTWPPAFHARLSSSPVLGQKTALTGWGQVGQTLSSAAARSRCRGSAGWPSLCPSPPARGRRLWLSRRLPRLAHSTPPALRRWRLSWISPTSAWQWPPLAFFTPLDQRSSFLSYLLLFPKYLSHNELTPWLPYPTEKWTQLLKLFLIPPDCLWKPLPLDCDLCRDLWDYQLRHCLTIWTFVWILWY